MVTYNSAPENCAKLPQIISTARPRDSYTFYIYSTRKKIQINGYTFCVSTTDSPRSQSQPRVAMGWWGERFYVQVI